MQIVVAHSFIQILNTFAYKLFPYLVTLRLRIIVQLIVTRVETVPSLAIGCPNAISLML